MNVRHPVGVLHSFFIKNIFYDKINLRLLYFHALVLNFGIVTLNTLNLPEKKIAENLITTTSKITLQLFYFENEFFSTHVFWWDIYLSSSSALMLNFIFKKCLGKNKLHYYSASVINNSEKGNKFFPKNFRYVYFFPFPWDHLYS